jgi:hypothetical protein
MVYKAQNHKFTRAGIQLVLVSVVGTINVDDRRDKSELFLFDLHAASNVMAGTSRNMAIELKNLKC